MSASTEHQVDTNVAFTGLEKDELPPAPSIWARIWSFAKKQPLGTGGLLLVLSFVFMAAFAEQVTVFDPESSSYEYMLQPEGTVGDEGTF